MRTKNIEPKWKLRLKKELICKQYFKNFNYEDWLIYLKGKKVTSSNYDTILALDWPHYCSHSTEGCGGKNGWCYTFQGNQVGKHHDKHVAMVDSLARDQPELFGDVVYSEIMDFVKKNKIPYPNLRYSGSGEVIPAYLNALHELVKRGVKLWGFSRDVKLALKMRKLGISVIISCDRTSSKELFKDAKNNDLPMAYTSMGVDDYPPKKAFVTFPVHRIGKVKEVVNTDSICPKVLSDFLEDSRPRGSCQLICRKCHSAN